MSSSEEAVDPAAAAAAAALAPPPAGQQQQQRQQREGPSPKEAAAATAAAAEQAPLTLASKALDAGAAALQSFRPLRQICQHVCAFHCYAHDASRQVVAHHYCAHASEEFRQCVIYDSASADARLIGIEYIISRRLFETLPDDEKRLWHSHAYEVLSGQLVAPGLPAAAAAADAAKLADTYGKTVHTWQVDRGDALPLGPPQLMLSFTADGQLDPALQAARDAALGTDTAATRRRRARLLGEGRPEPHPLADWPYRSGRALQFEAAPRPFKPPAPAQQHALAEEGPEFLRIV